jgi:hypothetical protein
VHLGDLEGVGQPVLGDAAAGGGRQADLDDVMPPLACLPA